MFGLDSLGGDPLCLGEAGREHIHAVKMSLSFFTGLPLLGVQFITSLETN
jgi:hypothetical protein